MNSDSFFTIGKTHTVCEDYARHGKTPEGSNFPGREYAIISDGCSGSPDTDFGSRFLTMTAIEAISMYSHMDMDEKLIIWRTKDRVNLPISSRCLDATLLMAYTSKEDGQDVVRVDASGDGVVVVVYKDGTSFIIDIDYDGAPGYLSYLISEDRKKQYIEEFGGKCRIRTHSILTDGTAEGKLEETVINMMTGKPTGGIKGCTINFAWLAEDVRMVMVCSDGIASFVDKDFNPVPMLDVAQHLIKIKNYNGEFVRKRVGSFLKRFCAKKGWAHADDISVSAIHIPDELEEVLDDKVV